MNRKLYVLIAVLALVVIIYFFGKKKSDTTVEKTIDAQIDEAITSVSAAYNKTAEDNVEVQEVTPEQEEYNLARDKYRTLYGSYPRSSWSLAQIEQAIKEKKEVDALIAQYISKGGDSARLEADEDIVTLAEINNYLAQLENEYSTVVEKAESELGTTINRTQYNTIAKVNQFKESELARMKKAWADKVSALSGRASEFQTHVTNQAKISFYSKIADDCNWFCGLPENEAIAVGSMVGWNFLLWDKLGWMKDDTRYKWEYRNAFAAANSRAQVIHNKQVDQYGRVI